MAYVKVSTTKNAIAALRYGEHEKGVIRGGVDCPEDTETAARLFVADRIMWNKDGGLQAHVVIQSFEGRECSPEVANEIGRELARKVAPNHRAMVYTHQDSEGGNIHNHIVICSVNQQDGHKLDTHGMLWKCRDVSNELTEKRGLSNIKERSAAMRYTQAERGLAAKNIQSWKDEIREVIDNAKRECRSVEEFKEYLKECGITINERNSRKEEGGKSWTYYHPNGGRVRAVKLGDDYSRSEVVRSLSAERRQVSALEKVKQSNDGGAALLDKALRSVNEQAENERILANTRKLFADDAVMKRALSGRSFDNSGQIQSRIALLSQALSVLDSVGNGGMVNLGAAMSAAAERAKIQDAIDTLKSVLSSTEAKAEAAKVFERW